MSSDDKYDSFDSYIASFNEPIGGSLVAGASYTANQTITLPSTAAGTYFVLFVADGSHNMAETNEANNLRAVPITLTPASADLEVTDAHAPSSTVPGQVSLSWTVTNHGPDPINSTWYDYVYLSTDTTYDISDTQISYSFTFPPVGAGTSYTRNVTGNLQSAAPGNYFLLFVADAFNYVIETDESNNIRTLPITVTAPSADLTVVSVDAPTTAAAGTFISVSWTVKNQGTGAAGGTWEDDISLSSDDQYFSLGSTTIFASPPIDAGGSYTRTMTVFLPGVATGEYDLRVVVYAFGELAESDDDNNVIAARIAITPAAGGDQADLSIENTGAPDSATAGEYVSVTWVVSNVGSAAATGNWLDTVYLSTDDIFDPATDTPLSSISIASQSPLIDRGGYIVSMDVLLPSSLASGDYYLLFAANSDEVQDESNRDNNVSDRFITVTRTTQPAPTVQSFLVNDGEAQRSMVTHLTLTFDGIVTIDDGAFALNLADGTSASFAAASRVESGQAIVTLTFTGTGIVAGSLADGRYTLTVFADKIHGGDGQALDGDADGAPGGDYVDELFRLYGDANGDAVVDNADYFFFRSTAGKRAGDSGFLWFLDSQGDGTVDIATDYAAFKGQNRKTV